MKAIVAFTILTTFGMMHAQLGHTSHVQTAAIASAAAAEMTALNLADADPPPEPATGKVNAGHSTARGVYAVYIGSSGNPEAFNDAVARVSGGDQV